MDFHFLLSQLVDHPIILFAISAYIGGEELIIPLSILVGHGLWDLQTLFIATFISTIMADLTWFLLGRHGIQKHRLFERHKHRYKKISKFIRKISKSEFKLLLITKFIYGTRIFSIIYLSLEGLSISKFLKLNFFVVSIWLSAIIGMGWMIGKGSTFFVNIYEHPLILTTGILILIFIFHFGRNYFSQKFLPAKLQK